MDYLNLPYPHGFLIWRGKQKAIASNELLDDDKYLITTDDDAFGEVTLGKPSAMAIDFFDKEVDGHCIRPYERKMIYPDDTSLYVYPIKNFKGFDEPVLFQNGEITSYKPTEDEQKMIDKASDLPKTIILDREAVSVASEGFSITSGVKGNERLYRTLEAIYEQEITKAKGDKILPVYQLALVRNPKLIVKKKEDKTIEEVKQMPWEIREDFGDCQNFAVVKIDDDSIAGCHDTQEDAEAQLTALVLSEEENKGLVATLEDVRNQLNQAFSHSLWLMEVEDDFVIAEDWDTETKYKIPFTLEDGVYTFAKMPEWVEVQFTFEEKQEAKSLKEKLQNAWDTIKKLTSWEDKKGDALLNKDYGFTIKEVNGKPWIITWSSNAFEDRDKEIISTKALEQWSEKINQQEDKGFFNLWHIGTQANRDLTDFAKKEWTGVPGRILVEAGPFLDNEKGQKALEFFSNHLDGHPDFAPEGWGCSIEFKYLPEERMNGVFENVEITRTSILPRFAAANIHTQIKEISMAMTDEQKEATLAVFGDELGNTLIEGAQSKSKELEENVAHKEEEGEDKSEKDTTDFDKAVEEIAKEVQVGFTQISEVLDKIEKRQTDLETELKSMQKQEAIKEETEMPRFRFEVLRASEADKTAIKKDSDLAESKPEENEGKPISMAGHFFQKGK